MNQLHRYIAKTVIGTTLFVIVLMLGLSFFINFLAEVHDIGMGNYGMSQAVMHVFLELPHNLYEFFPMIVLIGGVMGLSILASHHELIVMRVSGMSLVKITRAVFSAAFVLLLVGLFIGEVIGPRAYYLAGQHKSTAQSKGQAVATASGVWIHEGNNFFHIDKVMHHQHLEGVTRYEFSPDHRLLASYYVKSMDYKNKQWHLSDMVKTTLHADRTIQERASNATWSFALNPTLLNIGIIEPDELPLSQLKNYTYHLKKNGLHAVDFQFNFWQRVFRPVTIFVMLLLAIPFVFTTPRSVTMGLRIVLGIVIGFTFYILNSLLGQLSIVFQLPPLFASVFPIVLFTMIGMTWLWWVG